MKRIYRKVLTQHFKQNRQMLFVMGPRQVGKTTIGLKLREDWPAFEYYTWDNTSHRKRLAKGEQALGESLNLGSRVGKIPLLVFDELHKMRQWKLFLKGLYDTFPSLAHILVTGSARLDVYQKGADSLMGRYFRYRIHPLSVREFLEPEITPEAVRPEPLLVGTEAFDALWRFGGFPDPLQRAEERYASQWRVLRNEQVFREELKDLSRIRDVEQLEILAEWVRRSVGSQVSQTSLSKHVGVSHVTVRKWLKWLTSLYYCFEVRPWARNVARSLIKEPKYYLVDWAMVEDPAARAENMVASHLLKAVHFWTDYGTGVFALHYVRDRLKREVDFLVTRDGHPWLLVEVKLNHAYSISPNLAYFQEKLKPSYALQVVFGMEETHRPSFLDDRPRIVPARSFLSQLV